MAKSIADILKDCHVIAVVGASSSPERASHRIASYLMSKGFKVVPVNPRETEVLGARCYPDLSSVPDKVDLVNVFRRSEDVPPVVDEAIKIGARVVWMQLGIVNQEAASRAKQAGLDVVMDACIMVEHKGLFQR